MTATSLDRSKAPANDNTLHDISPYYSGCPCSHTTPTHHPNLIPPPNLATHSLEEVSYITRDRIHLLCTAFHLTLLAMIRTLSSSSRSCHWRRQEMLKWAVAIALHVGPFACLYLINHWSSYVNAKEAVIWLAPAILTAMGNLNSLPATTPSTKVLKVNLNERRIFLSIHLSPIHVLTIIKYSIIFLVVTIMIVSLSYVGYIFFLT
ncbi:unnamed protein product [Trichobilharzia regenti]|nr:unnamed protein product [Trichobilharzia regenti]